MREFEPLRREALINLRTFAIYFCFVVVFVFLFKKKLISYKHLPPKSTRHLQNCVGLSNQLYFLHSQNFDPFSFAKLLQLSEFLQLGELQEAQSATAACVSKITPLLRNWGNFDLIGFSFFHSKLNTLRQRYIENACNAHQPISAGKFWCLLAVKLPKEILTNFRSYRRKESFLLLPSFQSGRCRSNKKD